MKSNVSIGLILVFCLLIILGLACKTRSVELQKGITIEKTEATTKVDSVSSFKETSTSSNESRELSGTWTFEEWYQADLAADTITAAVFPPINKTGSYYRKSTFTGNNKTTKEETKKDISLDKKSSIDSSSITSRKQKQLIKQTESKPDYMWIPVLVGIIVLICFVAYIFYRKSSPVAKIIRMIPDNYHDA